MLLDKTIEVFIIARTMKHYRERGYDPQILKPLTINPSDTEIYMVSSILYTNLIISDSEYDLEQFFNSINDTSEHKSKLVSLIEAFNRKQKIDTILER